MANPWRKALSSFLSIVLVAGLLPCASFYGSAWASEAEGSPDADAAQIAEASSAADAAQASESSQLATAAQTADSTQPADSTQLATAAQSATETLPFGNTISAAGENHSAAITQNGELWTWGRNSEFQLGYSSSDEKNSYLNKLMDDVASVALGTNFSAAVKKTGSFGRGVGTIRAWSATRAVPMDSLQQSSWTMSSAFRSVICMPPPSSATDRFGRGATIHMASWATGRLTTAPTMSQKR